MNDGRPIPSLYLKAGELILAKRPCVVTTVLGSCIAVTMYNAERRLAAICHAMLPAPAPDVNGPRRTTAWQFVSLVVPEMLARFRDWGVSPGKIETKMFGGGDIFGHCRGASACVGAANIDCARDLLIRAGVAIRAANVGGRRGRRIVFDSATGTVRLFQLPVMPVAA